ncbi:hypothetical protein ACSSS7_000600 [Eimeria intestinalis]
MSIRKGEGGHLIAAGAGNSSVACTQAGAFVCPESVYYCEVLQRNAAWIILSKGVRHAEQQVLELGAAWMGALLEQVGRQARLFATLRGTAAVNYCDIKQALRAVCPSAYALLFAASVDPLAPRSPKQLPPKPQGPPIIISDESWLLSDLLEQREKLQANSPAQGEPDMKGPHDTRPAHVPDYLPKYPPAHLYRRTEAPWSVETDPHVAEFRRKYRKLELQLQLPQLQLPEPLREKKQGGFQDVSNTDGSFWGVPTAHELQEQQRGPGDQRQQQPDSAELASRTVRKADPGAGDRPAVDLYLR